MEKSKLFFYLALFLFVISVISLITSIFISRGISTSNKDTLTVISEIIGIVTGLLSLITIIGSRKTYGAIDWNFSFDIFEPEKFLMGLILLTFASMFIMASHFFESRVIVKSLKNKSIIKFHTSNEDVRFLKRGDTILIKAKFFYDGTNWEVVNNVRVNDTIYFDKVENKKNQFVNVVIDSIDKSFGIK